MIPVNTVGVVVPETFESLNVPFPEPVSVSSGDVTVEVTNEMFAVPEVSVKLSVDVFELSVCNVVVAEVAYVVNPVRVSFSAPTW